MRHPAILLLLISAWVPSLPAQRRFVRTYDQEQGLVAPNVLALAQDSVGYLWIGTPVGVFRFGGAEIRQWPAEFRGVVRALRAGPGAVVALDGSGRVFRAAPTGFVVVTGPDGGPVTGASDADVGPDGWLWVLWPDRVAIRRPDGRWRAVTVAGRSRSAWRLIRAEPGGAYLASGHEVARVRGDSGQWLARLGFVVDLVSTASGDLIAAAWDQGDLNLRRLRGGQIDALARLADHRPIALAVRNGVLWLSFDRGIAAVRPDGGLDVIDAARGVPDGGPLLADREGSLWLGTFHGLRQFPEPETVFWNELDGLPSSHARYVEATDHGASVSTWGGLARVMSDEQPALSGPQVVGRLCHTATGRILGTDVRQIWLEWRHDGWRRLPWVAPGIEDCAATRFGTIGASWRGLVEIPDRGVPRVIPDTPAVNSIAVDSAGGLWAAGDATICRRSAAAGPDLAMGWTCDTLPGAGAIYDIAALGSEVWAASQFRGVLAWTGASWARADIEAPVANYLIYGFETEGASVWLLGAAGTVRVARQRGQAAWREVERLSSWQGVPGVGASGLAIRPDGALWLANSFGVIHVAAAARAGALAPPRADLAAILVNGRPVDPTRVVAVPPGEAVVELHFAALTYRDRSRLRVEVRLGNDRPWLQADNEGLVYRLTGLRPGRYAVQARASLDGRRWSAPSQTVMLGVRAPWYREPWFPGLIAVVLAGLVVVRQRARTALLVGLERQRTAIAMDLHDELGAGLGSIGILAGVATAPSVSEPERRQLLERIGAAAGELGGKLTDIVGLLHSGGASAGSLAAEIAEQATRLVPGPVPALVLRFEEPLSTTRLPIGVRHDLRLIVLEAVRNAVRHAAAATITIGFRTTAHHGTLWVEDDGAGFDVAAPPPSDGGRGLAGMGARARRHGADLEVASVPGRTRITVRFPA